MPPPMTAIRRSFGHAGADHTVGERGHHRGVVVDARRAGEGEAVLVRPPTASMSRS